MNLKNLKLDWLSRLGKVVFVFLAIIAIPSAFGIGSGIYWDQPLSTALLLSALYLLIFYLILVLVTKTLLYIVKGENFLKTGFNKRSYLLLSIPVVLLFVCGLILSIAVEPIQERKEKENVENKYSEALSIKDAVIPQLRECFAPVIEEKYNEETRSCILRRNKVKHDYDFCVSLTSINSPASCLYDHDYQSIDCSEDTLRPKAESKVTMYELSSSCQELYTELNEANEIIENYKSYKN